ADRAPAREMESTRGAASRGASAPPRARQVMQGWQELEMGLESGWEVISCLHSIVCIVISKLFVYGWSRVLCDNSAQWRNIYGADKSLVFVSAWRWDVGAHAIHADRRNISCVDRKSTRL